MRDEVTILKVDGVTRDEELLRRHVDRLDLAGLALDANRQIILHVQRNLDAVVVNHRLHHGLALLDDLNARIVQQHDKLGLGQAVVLFLVNLFDFLVEELDDASAEQQRILEEGVQQLVAVVLVLDDVVDVIRRLLCGLGVLAGSRRKTHILVVRREHPHQVRHDRLNRVGKLGGDDSGPALHLVAQRLAEVEVERAQAILRVLAVEVVQRVSDLSADNRTKLYVIHLRHHFAFFLTFLTGTSPFIRTLPLLVLTLRSF